jgi:hypothetical protein
MRLRTLKGAAAYNRMVRSGVHHVQPARIKGLDHVPQALHGEADTRGDLLSAFPRGTRQHDLGTAPDKGIGRAQAILQRLALRVRERTHRQGSDSTHASRIPDRKRVSWTTGIAITEDEQ